MSDEQSDETRLHMSYSPNKRFIDPSDEVARTAETNIDTVLYKTKKSDESASEEERVQLTVSKKDGEDERYYTVEDAVNEMGFGPFQILITAFCGMIWMADAMELMVLAVLSPIVECEWDLTKVEEALITSVVFIGFLFGGIFWGWLADVWGRKITLFILTIVVVIFAVASAFSPNYALLLVFRFGMGFGIGGAAQAVTYYVEFLPNRMRGVCVVLLELWWAVGSIFAALLAMIIIPRMELNWGWRVYLGVCAAPLFLVIVFFPFIPESSRYYLLKGKNDKAMKVIRWVARFNFRPIPRGKLVTQEVKEQKEAAAKLDNNGSPEPIVADTVVDAPNGITHNHEADPLLDHDELADNEEDQTEEKKSCFKSFRCRDCLVRMAQSDQLKQMFSGGMWITTVLLLLLWFGCAWLYYGAVLLATTILQFDPHCAIFANETELNLTNDSALQCESDVKDEDFYLKITWTAAAEFPGIIVTLVIIELIGRKWTIAIEFLATGIFYGLLFICADEIVLTIFLFGVRAFATGVFQAVYVYTPEVFPTAVRGVAMGLNTSVARVGALITPFVAQVLFHWNDYVTISLYTASCLVLVVLSLLLPIETKGRALKDSKG